LIIKKAVNMNLIKFLLMLSMPLLLSCQKDYPLQFSIDGNSWSKELEYNKNDGGIKVWGRYRSQYNCESYLHIGFQCINDSCFINLGKENFNIESSLKYIKQAHISTDGSSASIALSVWHRNFRELPKKHLINYIDSTYIIVNLNGLFEDDFKVHVKMDVMDHIIDD